MGWASGSILMAEVLKATFPHMAPRGRAKAAAELIRAFADEDCDTLDECRDLYPEFDEALDRHYGPRENEDDI